MFSSPRQAPAPQRLAIIVRGVVQGVGFRPFVYKAARARELSGWVLNEADLVQIEVQGPPERLDEFVDALRREAPPQAQVESVEATQIACRDDRDAPFAIRASTAASTPRPTIPADLATCGECLAEIRAPAERRFRYPFTNCTNCGPRWSIITQLPYDRPRTSMVGFPMCPDCQREYDEPGDRRFHAQPVACPVCGPMLALLDSSGQCVADAEPALARAVQAIVAGRILALKGLGGFQLLVDARNEAAVAELRRRKHRPDKPLALMFHDLAEIAGECEVSDEEARVLSAAAAPIVLLRRRAATRIAPAVAPGNPTLGAMLPYTPLHHLLMAALPGPIVCTSGNLSEEPMAIEIGEALARLGSIADLVLTHNRPIVRPVDDSVAQLRATGLQVVRRARGYAPLPIAIGQDGPPVLATGGHLKNTVALALGSQVVLSAHVGDLESVLGVEVHRRAIHDLLDFFQTEPKFVACDLHPDYASTKTAEALAARCNVPLLRVQHHHAHVAACMAEHGLSGPLLGLSWDGTGYGPDATIWGGEALACEGARFTRAAHLRTFRLPGGDAAARQPRRSALAALYAIDPGLARQRAADWFTPAELTALASMLDRGFNAPLTSSMGRLFDAVAALCGLWPTISFEGQAAMALQFAAEPFAAEAADAYPLPLLDPPPPMSTPSGQKADEAGLSAASASNSAAGPAVADWEPLLRAVLDDCAAGVPIGRIGMRFHNALAELAVAIARRVGLEQVVLTGGCFQNNLLSDAVYRRLTAAGFQVFAHQRIPPGDGGIALGQVLIARRQASD
jgi:hydrogenase maturation protein HypF